MNTAALKKTEIVRELALLPEDQLERVQTYIASLVPRGGRPPRRSLKGIWEGLGFEKIADLEAELAEARAELTSQITRREL